PGRLCGAPAAVGIAGLLLDLELGVDHVLLAAAGARSGAVARRPGTPRLTAAALDVLGHGVGRLLQLVQGLADGVDVRAAGRLLRLLDRGLDRRLVGRRQLVAVVLQLLLDAPDPLVRLVAGVGELTLALVLVGVRLGVAAHLLHLGRAQAAGALDADLLL